MRKLIGGLMLAAPFAAMTAAMVAEHGWLSALSFWGMLIGFLVWVAIATELVSPQ